MILLECPEFPEENLPTLGLVMGKSTSHFRKVCSRLKFLIKGGEKSGGSKGCYQSTYISEELILHGFSPFDSKNRSYTANVHPIPSPQECRKNLKQLIVWLCEAFKSPNNVNEKIDPLKGKEPLFYGLSKKEGKCYCVCLKI